jgi:TonB family protein
MTGKVSTNALRYAITLALLCMCWPSTAVEGAQPTPPSGNTTDIRLLYESADYEGALALAARLEATTLGAEDVREIQLYEALCELAMGKQARAESKLESILQADPLYQPPDGMPNRIRLLTDHVRSRLAPALAQARYRAGKTHFDAKNCTAAAAEFALVLDLVPSDAGETPQQLDDVRTLASGFLALCNETLAARPAATTRPASTPVLANDPDVVPPMTVHRDVPAWPVQLRALRRAGDVTFSGIVEVSVNKNGRVEAARIIERIHPLYDGLLLAAAKNWVFEPATKNREPVDYVLHLKVDVQ